jgi:SEC-C motif domain protein
VSVDERSPCPCSRVGGNGRVLAFAQCCGRFLADFAGQPAPDAESLMRSRYCGYVVQDARYLLATWHASTRPSRISFEPDAKWLGLEVKDHRVAGDTQAEVEFVARVRNGGRATRLHERSRFVREQGRWYYVDGEHL